MRREQAILPYITGKKVLDIGSIGQSDEYRLWDFLSRHCASLTGIDLPGAKDTAARLFALQKASLGHAGDQRIVYGNMESCELKEIFDIVVAGDVIEHVNNPGLFLDNIRRHLRSDGKLIITTPNAKWPTVFLKPNPTHVLWHDRYTVATLLERHHFQITRFEYYAGNKLHYNFIKRILAWRQGLLIIAELRQD